MRLHNQVAGVTIALAMAVVGSVSLAAQSPAPSTTKAAATKSAAAPSLATLKSVKAVPMTATELQSVKGLHVHFLDAGGGKLHLAGDVKTQNNWENLGGSDGVAVAPSYHGLCIAAGISGAAPGSIAIPGGMVECPL